jgi:hypothetical protein
MRIGRERVAVVKERVKRTRNVRRKEPVLYRAGDEQVGVELAKRELTGNAGLSVVGRRIGSKRRSKRMEGESNGRIGEAPR